MMILYKALQDCERLLMQLLEFMICLSVLKTTAFSMLRHYPRERVSPLINREQ